MIICKTVGRYVGRQASAGLCAFITLNCEESFRIGFGPSVDVYSNDEKSCEHHNLKGTYYTNAQDVIASYESKGYDCVMSGNSFFRATPNRAGSYAGGYCEAGDDFVILLWCSKSGNGYRWLGEVTWYYPEDIETGTWIRTTYSQSLASSRVEDSVVFPSDLIALAKGYSKIGRSTYYRNTTAVSGSTVYTREEIWSKMLRLRELARATYGTPLSADLGDIAHKAIENTKALSNNVILYMIEIANLKKSITDLIGAFKALGLDFCKDTLDSLYLNWKYGLPLSFAETVEMIKSFGKVHRALNSEGNCKTSAGGTVTIPSLSAAYEDLQASCTYAIIYREYNCDLGLLDSWRTLSQWGINPFDLSNLWDAVPMSFVVNWFIDVESLLERFDTDMYYHTMTILYSRYSLKYSIPQTLISKIFGDGHGLSMSFYSRQYVTGRCHNIQPFSSGTTAQNHLVELSALYKPITSLVKGLL